MKNGGTANTHYVGHDAHDESGTGNLRDECIQNRHCTEDGEA